MIEFKRKYSLKNGNKINKKNWNNVIAKSSKPCTSVFGVPAIDREKNINGAYYEEWKLVYEKRDDKHDRPAGYIFREINHNGGITGRHKTYRQAIFSALGSGHISVYLKD